MTHTRGDDLTDPLRGDDWFDPAPPAGADARHTTDRPADGRQQSRTGQRRNLFR